MRGLLPYLLSRVVSVARCVGELGYDTLRSTLLSARSLSPFSPKGKRAPEVMVKLWLEMVVMVVGNGEALVGSCGNCISRLHYKEPRNKEAL